MSDDKFTQRVAETRNWMDDNCDSDDGYEFTDDDAIEHLLSECGAADEGYCTLAGTEYCDFECPFGDMEDEDE